MAKLAFSVVNSQGGSWEDVQEHGTLDQALSPNEEIWFSDKNINSNRRVVVMISDGKGGAPSMVSCSESLSNIIRKVLPKSGKQNVLKALLDLRVIENEQGFFLIPNTGEQERFSVRALRKSDEPVVLEDLIAL